MSSFRKGLACVAIVLNALCSGGIFTFPLMSPVLADHSKLSQPQLTTIALAGMMSQYTVASIVGKVIDVYGPSICSLIAAALLTTAFAGFSAQIYFSPDEPTAANSLAMFRGLTLAFFGAGMGTVFGYFSSLFAASKIFPRHIGVASGTSMALFGLSPLFLSVIASTWFTDPATQILNVASFTGFLSIFSAVVYLSTAYFLHINSKEEANEQEEPEDDQQPTETSSLLARDRKPPAQAEQSVAALFSKPEFWLLAVFCLITLGASEMIISNIGTIVVSLPPVSIERSGNAASQASTAQQVKLLSLSNTISRISVGLIADFVSPIASLLPSGVQVFPQRHRITRVIFLTLSSLVLAWTFWWASSRAVTRDDVWVLSVGTGIGYSAVFTVL
ncbi:major facilitator superfamily domain-containing protein [Coprinopsis sp. MPI-PUGE-AT-0042]|nr:major facilitator superfamily domain-containing protein [Coprinopsis sp. MPI-PUGE-AT-0042]